MKLNILKKIIIVKLRTVRDPEVGVGVYDLGFVVKVSVRCDQRVVVGLVLSTSKCPYYEMMVGGVRDVLGGIRWIRGAEVVLRD